MPEQTTRAIRSRARDLAWERIAPKDVFESKPLPEAIRISDTISQIQENLQERARIAQNARDEFLVAKIRDAELRHGDREGVVNDFSFHEPKEERDRFAQAVIANLSSEDAQKLVALDLYVAQTREEVYRGFEAIDIQRRDLEMALDKSAPPRVESYSSLQEGDIRSP